MLLNNNAYIPNFILYDLYYFDDILNTSINLFVSFIID